MSSRGASPYQPGDWESDLRQGLEVFRLNPSSEKNFGNHPPPIHRRWIMITETLALTASRTRGILGALDILVDIGVFAEKEVIQ